MLQWNPKLPLKELSCRKEFRERSNKPVQVKTIFHGIYKATLTGTQTDVSCGCRAVKARWKSSHSHKGLRPKHPPPHRRWRWGLGRGLERSTEATTRAAALTVAQRLELRLFAADWLRSGWVSECSPAARLLLLLLVSVFHRV